MLQYRESGAARHWTRRTTSGGRFRSHRAICTSCQKQHCVQGNQPQLQIGLDGISREEPQRHDVSSIALTVRMKLRATSSLNVPLYYTVLSVGCAALLESTV